MRSFVAFLLLRILAVRFPGHYCRGKSRSPDVPSRTHDGIDERFVPPGQLCFWNQGYANSGEGLPYYHNLHSLIRGWRQLWNRPDLPVYFHQFYCPGQKGEWNNSPSIGGTAEMRLGTWLARDIPHSGMASQINITGAIHYTNKTVPGQRLALHALRNQYSKDLVADGPMFKSYKVAGDKLIIDLEHADSGLLVAETGTNSKDGLATPTIVPNGDDQVKLFHLADENRVWHPASMKIDGVEPDPTAGGLLYEYRKMPLLSTQFRDNAVLQAGTPVTITLTPTS